MTSDTQIRSSSESSLTERTIGDEMYPRGDWINTTSGHFSGLVEKRKALKL
jgi:hypothetical protein